MTTAEHEKLRLRRQIAKLEATGSPTDQEVFKLTELKGRLAIYEDMFPMPPVTFSVEALDTIIRRRQ